MALLKPRERTWLFSVDILEAADKSVDVEVSDARQSVLQGDEGSALLLMAAQLAAASNRLKERADACKAAAVKGKAEVHRD